MIRIFFLIFLVLNSYASVVNGDFYLLETKLNNNKIYAYLEKENEEVKVKFSNFSSEFNSKIYDKNRLLLKNIENNITFDAIFDLKPKPNLTLFLNNEKLKFQISSYKINTLKYVKTRMESKKLVDNKELNYVLENKRYLFLTLKNINKIVSLDAKNLTKLTKKMTKNQKIQMRDIEKFKFNSEYLNNFNIDYIDDKIISFVVSKYEYTGGAHGILNIKPLSFSLLNGELVSNKSQDLFNNVNDKKLLNLLLDKFIKTYGKNKTDAFLKWKKTDFIPLPEYFYIDNNGIKFIFSPYELAPYSDGFISVVLNLDDIKDYVSDKYKNILY